MNCKWLILCDLQLFFSTEGCLKPNWHGDGYCDDVTNVEACFFDGGDCCGNDVNTDYCEQCFCYEEFPECVYLFDVKLIGNGVCNDETNIDVCNFDGGDCCGSCIDVEHCTECICYGEIIYDEQTGMDSSCKWLVFCDLQFGIWVKYFFSMKVAGSLLGTEMECVIFTIT